MLIVLEDVLPTFKHVNPVNQDLLQILTVVAVNVTPLVLLVQPPQLFVTPVMLEDLKMVIIVLYVHQLVQLAKELLMLVWHVLLTIIRLLLQDQLLLVLKPPTVTKIVQLVVLLLMNVPHVKMDSIF